MKESIHNFMSRGYTLLIFIMIVGLCFTLLVPSGPLRALIVLIILFLVGLLLVQEMMIFSKPINEWMRKESLDRIEHLLMPSVQVFVKGAIAGSEYSRERIHDDIRRWFFSKVKTERGINDRKLDDLQEDPQVFKHYIGDEKIVGFLINGYTGSSFTQKKVRSFMSKTARGRDREYERWLKDLLLRMEEWE